MVYIYIKIYKDNPWLLDARATAWRWGSSQATEGGRVAVPILMWHCSHRLSRAQPCSPMSFATFQAWAAKVQGCETKGYMEEVSGLKSQSRKVEDFTNSTLVQRPARAVSGICLVTALRSHPSLGRRDIRHLPLVFLMSPSSGSPGQWEVVPDEL